MFSAGWSMAGYLPDNPPVVFADRRDAIAYLVDTVERFWDQDYQWLPGEEADERWLDIHTQLHLGLPGGVGFSGAGLVFWIEESNE